jgi:hypothetical protein
LTDTCLNAISKIKHATAAAVLAVPDANKPFIIECDASGYAVGAVLSQMGQPVAFMSQTLSQTQRKWAAPELETFAIVQAIKKFEHFVSSRKFDLITDQQGIAYLLSGTNKTRIKNDKLQRWRLEFAPFNFSIHYRPGALNTAADALSRSIFALSIEPCLNAQAIKVAQKKINC